MKNSINNNWGTTLSIGEYGTGHAITMWGYDMDADGNLIIYLTDSDDYALGMFRQKVIVDDEKHIYLTSVDGENNVYGYNYGEAGLTGTRLGELQSFTAPLGDLRIPGTRHWNSLPLRRIPCRVPPQAHPAVRPSELLSLSKTGLDSCRGNVQNRETHKFRRA